MSEKWLPIIETEGVYQVSSHGNVRSFKQNSTQGRLITPHINGRGYYAVSIDIKGVRKTVLLHRLVANAFLHNPEKLPVVNHINGDKLNCCVDNLEWCSYSHNLEHAYKTGLKQKSKPPKCCKPVKQYSLNNEYIKTWDSAVSAAKFLQKDPSAINRACQSHTHRAYGYLWFR